MLKKIFTELFSPGTLQAESTASAALPETFNASASLSADAIHDLECRKRAIVSDITRLAAELAACPDLGAPVGGLTGTAALGCPAPPNAQATFALHGHAAAASEWFGRGEPWTGERASTRADLSATLRDADRAWSEYSAWKQGAK